MHITFRHMDTSPALEARIRAEVVELEQFFGRITGCRVVVECPHARHRQGKLFQVRIHVIVPGCEIIVGHDAERNHAHEDPYVAVRDAFNAVRRRLEDYARAQRGDVKTHAMPGQIH